MKARGLAISAAGSDDKSAYTHRVTKLAECLTLRDIDCDFFFMPDHPPLDTQTTASLFMPFWLPKLRKYDFIYCGGEESGQSLFFCKPLLDCPIIIDIHGNLIAQSALARETESKGADRSASWRVRMIDAMGKRVASHFLTVCKPQTEALIESGVAADNISLIRNGADLDLFKQIPFPAEPEFMFAYIGEFQVWQGIDNLIAAFERLDASDGRMLVVGFRQEDRSWKTLFKDKFGDRVELVDRVDRPKLMELIGSVGILMIPRHAHLALKNAFPTKFAEYAAMGRPIMVNDVDETAEFVRRYGCGFVSEPAPDRMAEVMKLAAGTDWNELSEMGLRGRKMAEENFSWNVIGDEYAKAVKTLLKKAQG